MAQKSGFFNTLWVGGEPDRKYNANDYTDNLAVVISNGVLRSENDDLKVTASGMTVNVAAGRAWINGHYYLNDSTMTFSVPTAPVGGSRWDRIMLRMNKDVSARSVTLVYAQGTASNNPVKPAPTRNGTIHDLVLADIFVNTNASNVAITDTRPDTSLCGWLYSTSGDNSFFTSLDNSFWQWFNGAKDTLSSVTLFKRYTEIKTVANTTSVLVINIPQCDPETCFIEVYVNGIFDNRHTINNNIITFQGTLTAGTVVTVNCYKSIDGTDIMSVSDEITALQNQFATLDGVSKFTYKCTGLNDNISLSQIAQAFYNGSYVAADVSEAARAFLTAIGGNTYLSALATDAQVTIDVVGSLGIGAPVGGSGTTESRYRYFALGVAGVTEKRIVFDFAKCDKINVVCGTNTKNIIFYGTDLFIDNANVVATSNGTGCEITMLAGSNNRGNMYFNNCRFKAVASDNAIIGSNGNFTNCILHAKSSAANAYCVNAKSESLIRLFGGTYFAYTAQASAVSACLNVDAGESDAVIMAQNINCPTISQTGYSQYYVARTYAGMTFIDGVVTTIGYGGNADNRNITGKVSKNKR